LLLQLQSQHRHADQAEVPNLSNSSKGRDMLALTPVAPWPKFSLIANKSTNFCYWADASMHYPSFSTKTVERYRIFALLGMSIPGQLVTCRVADLRLHPSYVRNGLTASACRLSALVELGDLAFLDPIVITRDRFVIDGYALLELARRKDARRFYVSNST
jgi:hypothetical protein